MQRSKGSGYSCSCHCGASPSRERLRLAGDLLNFVIPYGLSDEGEGFPEGLALSLFEC
jgi:hypothetical protein